MMKSIWVLAIVAVSQGQIQQKDNRGVMELDWNNFDSAIRYHKYIFIDFYAPWCSPCRQFNEQLVKMSQILKANPRNKIDLASYDVTQEEKIDQQDTISKRYKITSYPTLLFFLEGVPIPYEGNRQIDHIISWMKQIMDSSPPIELKTIEEINDFASSNDLSVLYFGGDNLFKDKNFWTFYQITLLSDEGTYGYTLNEKLIQQAGGKQQQLFVYNNAKPAAERKRQFNQAFTRDNIQRFIQYHTLPDVPHLNPKTEKLVFNSVQATFLLFLNYDDESVRAEQNFIDASKQFKNHYQFVISRVTDELFFPTLDRLGAEDEGFPKIIVYYPKDNMKYKYERDDFSVEGIKKFIFEFRQGKLKRFVKSEAIPSNETGMVKKIVSVNFEEEVLKTKKDVLVEYTQIQCPGCKEFEAQYEYLGYLLRDNENIVVGKFNLDLNEEVVNYQIKDIPAFLFFKGDEKVKKPLVFYQRNVTQLISFAKNHTTYEWVDVKEN